VTQFESTRRDSILRDRPDKKQKFALMTVSFFCDTRSMVNYRIIINPCGIGTVVSNATTVAPNLKQHATTLGRFAWFF
jgi:hypothetical protein